MVYLFGRTNRRGTTGSGRIRYEYRYDQRLELYVQLDHHYVHCRTHVRVLHVVPIATKWYHVSIGYLGTCISIQSHVHDLIGPGCHFDGKSTNGRVGVRMVRTKECPISIHALCDIIIQWYLRSYIGRH